MTEKETYKYKASYRIVDCEHQGDIDSAITEVKNAGGIVDSVEKEYKGDYGDSYEDYEWYVEFHCDTEKQFNTTCRTLHLYDYITDDPIFNCKISYFENYIIVDGYAMLVDDCDSYFGYRCKDGKIICRKGNSARDVYYDLVSMQQDKNYRPLKQDIEYIKKYGNPKFPSLQLIEAKLLMDKKYDYGDIVTVKIKDDTFDCIIKSRNYKGKNKYYAYKLIIPNNDDISDWHVDEHNLLDISEDMILCRVEESKRQEYINNIKKHTYEFRHPFNGFGETNFKTLLVNILSQNGYTNGKDYKIRYFKSSPYRANRGEKNVQECWLTVRNAPTNVAVAEDDFDDIESLTNYVCGLVDSKWSSKKKAKQATTFHVGDLICYKGIEESIFKIVATNGNNYIVVEIGDRTKTENKIPFADNDKLQRAVSPLLITEAKLAKIEAKQPIDLSLKLTDDDKKYLRNTGSYVSDYDFAHLEDAVKKIDYYLIKDENDTALTSKNFIRAEKAIELLGREEFWSGIYRAAYHGSAMRAKDYSKPPFVFFSKSRNLSGISGTSENLSGILKPIYYDNDTEDDESEYGSSRTATKELLKDVKAFAQRLKIDLGLEDYYRKNKKQTVTTNHIECSVHFIVPQAQAPKNHLHIRFYVNHPLRGVNYDYELDEWFPISLGEEHSFGNTMRCSIYQTYDEILRDLRIRYPEFKIKKADSVPEAELTMPPILKTEAKLIKINNEQSFETRLFEHILKSDKKYAKVLLFWITEPYYQYRRFEILSNLSMMLFDFKMTLKRNGEWNDNYQKISKELTGNHVWGLALQFRQYLTDNGISGINIKSSPILIHEAKLAKIAQITLQRASNLVVDYERYGKTMVFEIANKKDAVNTPFMLAEDFFDSHPESRIPVKFNFDIEDIKSKYAQDNLLQRGADIYFSLFPKGVRDMYIMELQGGKIVATTKYKSRTYRPYEYIKITDLKSLGVSSLNELIVTDINKYFDLFRKGRELLSSGDYTGKKSDKRIGVDWLKGKDANCQMLSESFGLRSIIYGTTKSKEIPIVNNNAYNAFMDLKMICGFKSPLIVSHKGTLALNFGAKKLGNYAAYYRAANKSLNLTRTEGSGSFAHEWFHSLDNYLGIYHHINTCPQYNMSFISWCNELYNNIDVTDGRRNKKMIQIAYQWGKDMRKLSLYEPSVDADRRKKIKYWSTPHEITARCFSYYVRKKLADKGYKNDYLVDERISNIYPKSEDEVVIIKFFDDFFKSLQTEFDYENNMPYLYGSEPEIPEIENAVSPEKMTQIPQTESDRRTFLDNELQRYKGTEVYSKYFNQNVKILGKSINEICKWAAIREASVIAALNIDGVIANATYVNESEPHNNTQKKKFRAIKMYELHCVIKGFGTAKLMVAEQVTGTKITYCITEIQI